MKLWAYVFFSRHGYGQRHYIVKFQMILSFIFGKVREVFIAMVVNFDQTGTKMVPVSDFTMEVY